MMKFNISVVREVITNAQKTIKHLTLRQGRPQPLFVGAATENPTMSTTRNKSMKAKFIIAAAAFAVACSATTSIATQPLGPGFTYQGRLNDGGAPANGNYDMIFNLYDAPTNGNVLGSFSIFGAVPVTNGLFTVELNVYNEFGNNAFNGQARWLGIGVRTNNNNAMNPWIYLDPRQPLDCTPQAMFAMNASNAMNASFAATVADGSISSSKLAPGAVAWTNITGIPLNAAIPYSAGPGLSLGWLNQFSVNFGGSGAANFAARSDHNHFGAGWSGSGSYVNGLSVTNSSPNSAVGLFGQQGTGSGFPYIFGNTAGVWGESSQGSGVWGASAYATGAGVVGMATATNTANFGVSGTSWSTSGVGVRGQTIATTGTATGVSGEAASTSGVGVRGLASATSGQTVGVRGETKSSYGYGIAGYASSLGGTATGVYGETAAINGSGLYGHSTFVSGNGPNYGVIGQSDSIYGYGVFGHTTSALGLNYGVAGQSDSQSGYGVYGLGASGVFGKSEASYGVGVVGQSDAVQGVAVIARSQSGISLKAQGTGVIQSDAVSVITIPGAAALGYGDDDQTYVRRNGSPRFTYALTVPAVLYGQQTTLKSIEISWSNEGFSDVHITGTRVYSGSYDTLTPFYKDSTIRSPGNTGTYTVQVNLPLDASYLPLNLAIGAIAPAHIPDYLTFARINSINLRFSHN
jgi:hypothetical protein